MAAQVDPKGNPAPAGGFKDGGWYSGYNYDGASGTFAPQAGVIYSKSLPQVGTTVSSEVNRQSDAAQGLAPGTIDSYVANQNSTPNVNGNGGGGGAPVLPSSLVGNLSSMPGSIGSGSGVNGGFTTPAPLDLPKLYDSLYSSAGIKDLEDKLASQDKAFADAQSKINDNPFLSEANRVGRIQKLQTDYNNNTTNLRNEVATKKADIETKLNIETKQFDINSQSAQQALSTFNTLLQMGALDGASGEDIANITRSTGVSSAAVMSAIAANKAKNVQTSVIQYDDGTNQGFAVINSQTGDIISRQVVAASAPKSSGVSASDQKIMDTQTNQSNASADAKRGATLRQLIGNYGVAGGLTVDQIYSIYNSNSPYGLAKESLTQAKQGVFADSKGFVSTAKTTKTTPF